MKQYVTFHDKTKHNALTTDWVKSIITNYNLWTATPANLKPV